MFADECVELKLTPLGEHVPADEFSAPFTSMVSLP